MCLPFGFACPSKDEPADSGAAPAEAGAAPAATGAAQAEAGASTTAAPTGSPAATGATGTTAAQGATGAPAATGATGATGSAAATGATGATGANAATGSTGAAAATGTTGAAAATGAEADPEAIKKALLEKIASTKQAKDDEAIELLDKAKEEESATVRELAQAANKRATRLFRYPDRAKRFFEYAMTVDETYPDAPFHLAKLAATTGDIIATKEHLTEVKKRGGKKLLSTVEFDPTFALVADDPDVRKLWQ